MAFAGDSKFGRVVNHVAGGRQLLLNGAVSYLSLRRAWCKLYGGSPTKDSPSPKAGQAFLCLCAGAFKIKSSSVSGVGRIIETNRGGVHKVFEKPNPAQQRSSPYVVFREKKGNPFGHQPKKI